MRNQSNSEETVECRLKERRGRKERDERKPGVHLVPCFMHCITFGERACRKLPYEEGNRIRWEIEFATSVARGCMCPVVAFLGQRT